MQLYEKYFRERGHPDLIHVHSMLNAGLLANLIQERYDVPYIVTEHSTEYARGLVLGWRRSAAMKVAERASKRLAVSKPLAELLERMLGAGAGAWDEMPNIVERRFGETPLGGQTAQGQGFRFITVALLTKKKGIHFLLHAFARAFQNVDIVDLEIGGDGPERPRLEELARDLGIADRVRFLGALSRDDVLGAMSGADAFVLASTVETFGVVVVEALALGKPVVATRCGGPESIVREEDGVLVQAGDVDALAEGMRLVRENYIRYDPLTIREACIRRFGEEAVMQRLTDVYRSVVRQATDN